ncbi:T6SS phospholipase effector Tle1-like catalytic domain-containing protein [Thauera sinica]|uniref:T6SS phospholipase effector Tle1-like catalytic domain-containing protein n=1 Tax=Thauera sinica TaxID=2665146 RepID=A0ABW1AT72_9RHOO|nr:DUF2235 domain-containing protein [Thauera sp. K11]ATE59934.1 hypothetical protein CCZ27_08215 [Thauera sp. K11]
MIDYVAAPARNADPTALRELLAGGSSLRNILKRHEARVCDADTGLGCTGQIHIGVFFDGTGNNKKLDYGDNAKPLPKEQWKHSNVARLFNAWPEPDPIQGQPTSGLYKYYIPGVGTPFPSIGDTGAGFEGKAGSMFAWNGEARILWGLIQVINALHHYYYRKDLIDAGNGESLCPAGRLACDLADTMVHHAEERRSEFRDKHLPRLRGEIKRAVENGNKPRLVRINLSVFGFSRGAAEARAFVNWLYELCDPQGGGWALAGIPLETQFMGLFDTVASVGLAAMWDVLEGRQSWADDNLQVHPAVRRCVHLVAAHEQRACFPLDSVRVDERYPANCVEYVYPGAHSDVGGGYRRTAQGKSDDFARIPGYAMYCEALEAGVPLLPLDQMPAPAREGLIVPGGENGAVFRAFERYMAGVGLTGGRLENLVRPHLQHYLTWRVRLGLSRYAQQAFVERSAEPEKSELKNTQKSLLLILAGVSDQLQERINKPTDDRLHLKPLDHPYLPGRFETLVGLKSVPALIDLSVRTYDWRKSILSSSGNTEEIERKSSFIVTKLSQWRYSLRTKSARDPAYPELRDAAAPDRDVLNLVESILPNDQKIPDAVSEFLAGYVHDSMAGFAVDEFLINGIGMAKFRRTYFGNRGDRIASDNYAEHNRAGMKRFEAERKNLRQWDLEAAEFARTR